MKTCCFLLFFSFFVSFTTAQNISNGYYFIKKQNIGFTSEAFQFYDDDKFYYVSSSCTGDGYGKGTYRITDSGNIILTFEAYDNSHFYKNLAFQKGVSDVLELHMTTIDNDGSPLPGATFTLPETDEKFTSDFDGVVSLLLKKPTQNCTLKVSFIGYLPVEIDIPKGATKISGKIVFGDLNLITTGTVWKLHIKNLKRSGFTLDAGNYPRRFVKLGKNRMHKKVKKHMPDFYEKLRSHFF